MPDCPFGQIAASIWGTDFEPAERDYVARNLRPGMTVINVGANVGLYALMASRIVGERGAVHAFEPSSESFERLRRNRDMNDCSNLQLSQIAS